MTPTNPTPTRTGRASALGSAVAATAVGSGAALGSGAFRDGSGSISVPTLVPGGVAKP